MGLSLLSLYRLEGTGMYPLPSRKAQGQGASQRQLPHNGFFFSYAQEKKTMQAFLKGTSVSTKPQLTKDRGTPATAGSSGETKKVKPVPWVEK